VHTPKVGRLLSADAGLEPVVAKALEIEALSKLCVDYLEPELGRQIRAANLKDGQLVVLAATPAAAAKLKLVSGGLVAHLSEQGAKVNSVSVRVQPNLAANTNLLAPPRGTASLSPAGVAALQELHHAMRDSPARDALGILLGHCAPTGATPSASGARKTPPEGKAPRGEGDLEHAPGDAQPLAIAAHDVEDHQQAQRQRNQQPCDAQDQHGT
jgi:hypothetical protein